MQISLREAATLLGRNPRTLRAQLARGELAGRKLGGRWTVDRRALPLTEPQREALQARAERIRGAVESALPSRTATRHGERRRSVADLDCFRAGLDLVRELRAACAEDEGRAAAASACRALERGLVALCQGAHAFEADGKLLRLRRARACFSRAVALLLLGACGKPAPDALRWVVRIEGEILPSLAGLLRWAERLAERRR